jgi:sirohydrochlorin cobaltochelatase
VERLRQRRLFARVEAGFWRQTPKVVDQVASLEQPRVLIVPFFITEGYFSARVIPEALGFSPNSPFPKQRFDGGREWIYTGPVGTHAGMTEVLIARAREIVAAHPVAAAPTLADISLFIAGHGTTQDENSRKGVERQVEQIRSRNLFGSVHGIFLEEAPFIQDSYRLAATPYLVVVPFFIADGLHCQEDIPVLLGEPPGLVQERLRAGRFTWENPTRRHGKTVWYTTSIGLEPLMGDVVWQRLEEASHVKKVCPAMNST